MKRKLFCEISPLTYKISMEKEILLRNIKDLFSKEVIAKTKQKEKLPYTIYKHNSLIRRKLGNVNMTLQENKAKNLALAAPKISGIIIKPGETFSFWALVNRCNEQDGYKEGLVIASGKPSSGIGGGMCQLTNLIHWMILHTDMLITEHHHHDQIDLFPDFKRVIPFGTGTSIMYNYLDYRFKNTTNLTYQLIIYVTDEYLCGELLADNRQDYKYHISAEDVFFSKEEDGVYRNGKVYREKNDCKTGLCVSKELIRVNHAKVCYDTSHLEVIDLTKENNKKEENINMKLKDKVAVVTGGAMGNGLGIVKTFLKYGAKVIVLDYAENIYKVVDELKDETNEIYGFKLDIRNMNDINKAIKRVTEKYDHIDILVNNAGVCRLEKFEDMDDELRDFHFDINIKGTWNVTKACLPYMKNRNASIVNLSSVTGPMVADSGEVAYATTKAAVLGFTKSLAAELVEDNIRVNAILPGYIRTPMVDGMAKETNPEDPESVVDGIAKGIPMKRLGKIEELGELAAFLASDESSYITAQGIVIDGGSTLPETMTMGV